jgi:NitT/TauT family transport system permease protein
MSETFSAILKPWMTVIKSTPVVSFILIALLWFGSSSVPVFVAILMTLPVMTEATAHGVRSSDPKLLEMARVYRMPEKDILAHIRLPSALPFLFSGAGASLGLTWKVVVAGEILSSPKYGIGSSMQTAKVHLETTRVFSLTLAAIALSIITELAFDALVRYSRRRSAKVET